jgi:hypothetical protein
MAVGFFVALLIQMIFVLSQQQSVRVLDPSHGGCGGGVLLLVARSGGDDHPSGGELVLDRVEDTSDCSESRLLDFAFPRRRRGRRGSSGIEEDRPKHIVHGPPSILGVPAARVPKVIVVVLLLQKEQDRRKQERVEHRKKEEDPVPAHAEADRGDVMMSRLLPSRSHWREDDDRSLWVRCHEGCNLAYAVMVTRSSAPCLFGLWANCLRDDF